jgi:hypothetical protein
VGVHEEHGHARLHRGRDLRPGPPGGRGSLTPPATPGPAGRRGTMRRASSPQYASRSDATSGSCAAFAAPHRLIPSSTWARVRGPPVNVGAWSLKNASTSARCASSQNDAPA